MERRTLKSTVPEGADTHAECLLVRQVSSDLETEQDVGDVHHHFHDTSELIPPSHSALTDAA